jgi:hypothetical protein
MVKKEKLYAALKTLPRTKQLAFATLVFERMLPSLIAFSKDTARDPSCYLEAREAEKLRGPRCGMAEAAFRTNH